MQGFDYFVVFAEMRTGSNFLEANLNLFDGVSCLGEVFNPHFIGYPNASDVLGVTQAARDKAPLELIATIRAAPGLNGFRYFNDHDPRVLDHCLDDRRCAKIILTRNPVDSFVSWKIAAATGQWKLTNVRHAKSEKVHFNADEFATHLEALQTFQVKLLNHLQRTGQTAFYVAYEDLQDVDVMNGLATYLGVADRISGLDKKLKKQNPEPIAAKVENFADMQAALVRLDRFNLGRTPNFEPRRGAVVPSYVAAPESGLMYLPVRSGPNDIVRAWLAGLDAAPQEALITGFNQKTLREWQQSHAGHRSFTVLRHPVARAHTAFCRHVLAMGPGSYPEIRASLRKVHKLPIPQTAAVPESDATYDMSAHRKAFVAFLTFLKANLSAQTAIRVDAAWATQIAVLQGMAEFGLPDMIAREDRLKADLAVLAAQIGKSAMPDIPAITDPLTHRLAAIYDDKIEALSRQAYARDYAAFGFGDWVVQAA